MGQELTKEPVLIVNPSEEHTSIARSKIGFANSEKVEILYSHQNALVGITDSRIFKIEKEEVSQTNIKDIKSVTHEDNSPLKWNKIIVIKYDSTSESFGIWGTSFSKDIYNYLNGKITDRKHTTIPSVPLTALSLLSSPRTCTLYAVLCEQGNIYVGSCEDEKAFKMRKLAHYEGTGCAFTAKYRMVDLIKVEHNTNPFYEDAWVIEATMNYPNKLVRGGKYSEIVLSKEQEEEIQKSIRAAMGKCFKCGKADHFVSQCSEIAKQNICKCGKGIDPKYKQCYACYAKSKCIVSKDYEGMIKSDKGDTKSISCPITVGSGDRKGQICGKKPMGDSATCYTHRNYSADKGCTRCGVKTHLYKDCLATHHSYTKDLLDPK